MASAGLTPATRPPPEASVPSKGAQQTGLRSRLQRHIVGAYLGMRPRGGSISCGHTSAREGTRRPARGAPAGRARAGKRRPRLAGRTRRRAAPLLGLSSGSSLHRRQPPSPAKQPSGPGGCRRLKSTSSRSFPHAVPRHRGLCPHTRAPTAARSLRSQKKKSKFKTKSCGDERARLTKVRRLGSLLAAAGRGGRGRARGSKAKSLSLSREARSARAEPAGPASGARAAPAAWGTTLPPALPHTSGPLAWGLGGLCGRRRRGTRVQGKRREEQGRAAPMHSRGGRLVPSTIAKNPPVSSRWRSGTSACVCL